MFRAVRIRLILYVVGILSTVLLAVGAAVYVLSSHQLDAAVGAQLHTAAARYAVALGPAAKQVLGSGGAIYVQSGTGAPSTAPAPLPPPLPGPVVIGAEVPSDQPPPADPSNDGTFVAELANGRTITRRGDVPPGLPDQAAIAQAKVGRDDVRTVNIGGSRYELLTRAAALPPGSPPIIVQAGVSLAARDREQRIVLLALAGGGLLGVVLTVAGGLFLTGRALAPIQVAFDRQRRFVGDASHELRTPLALLRLEAEDLARHLDAADRARPLLRQVDRTARLVDDLLVLAQIDEDALPFEHEPVHVGSLLDDAAAAARRLATPTADVSCVAAGDLWVAGDRDRLRRVLLILVENACRVVPAGGRISLEARSAGGHVELRVSDSGPGIPREHVAHVFERFYRVDRGRTRAAGGAGLGLSIAREIVLAHGGAIELESAAGKGTTATVRLELAPAPRAAEELAEFAI